MARFAALILLLFAAGGEAFCPAVGRSAVQRHPASATPSRSVAIALAPDAVTSILVSAIPMVDPQTAIDNNANFNAVRRKWMWQRTKRPEFSTTAMMIGATPWTSL